MYFSLPIILFQRNALCIFRCCHRCFNGTVLLKIVNVARESMTTCQVKLHKFHLSNFWMDLESQWLHARSSVTNFIFQILCLKLMDVPGEPMTTCQVKLYKYYLSNIVFKICGCTWIANNYMPDQVSQIFLVMASDHHHKHTHPFFKSLNHIQPVRQLYVDVYDHISSVF